LPDLSTLLIFYYLAWANPLTCKSSPQAANVVLKSQTVDAAVQFNRVFVSAMRDTNFFLSRIERPEFAEGLHDAVTR
jgi:hypothetical protein